MHPKYPSSQAKWDNLPNAHGAMPRKWWMRPIGLSLTDKVKRTAFVASDGLGHKGDKVHFSAAAFRELGERYAKAYLEHFASPTPTSVPAKRPNILFAIADDWGFGHAGAYGCNWVRTPSFDRVARDGILFKRAYTPNAKCAPSRAIILTGRYSWQLEEAANHHERIPFQVRWIRGDLGSPTNTSPATRAKDGVRASPTMRRANAD